MGDPLDSIKAKAARLETPLLVRHVESHLIFGPLSRHFPLAYLALGIALVSLVVGFFATDKSMGQYLGSIVDMLIFLVVPLLLLRMTYRQQAIIGWIAVKLALGFAAFIMVTVGAGMSFQNHQADAWPNLFLGLIWIPGLEFIPKVTPHQRNVTLARVVLSLPCIYFGVKSGNWHW
jgi:hypothetical protein